MAQQWDVDRVSRVSVCEWTHTRSHHVPPQIAPTVLLVVVQLGLRSCLVWTGQEIWMISIIPLLITARSQTSLCYLIIGVASGAAIERVSTISSWSGKQVAAVPTHARCHWACRHCTHPLASLQTDSSFLTDSPPPLLLICLLSVCVSARASPSPETIGSRLRRFTPVTSL